MRHLRIRNWTVKSLQFGADGRKLYLLVEHPEQQSGHFHSACCLELSTGGVASEWQLEPCNVAIFSPTLESIFYDCGGDFLTEIHKTDLRTNRDDQLLQADLMYVDCLAVTPNQHLVALGGWERIEGELVPSVRRLDAFRGTLLDSIRTAAKCAAYSPDGQLLAVGGMVAEEHRVDGPLSGVRVWSGRQLLGEFPPTARLMAWSPDGRLAWGTSGQLNVGRPGIRESLRSWEDESGEKSAHAFSPDGRLLLTSTDGGACAFHDPVAGEVRAAFDWGIGPIHSVAFSPDGLTCAAGGEKGQVVVWDVDA